MFDPPPKPRRRTVVRLAIPILIVVGVIAAVVVAEAGEETQTEIEYLDQIRDQATELSRSGASLQDVLSRLRDVGRDEFNTVFDGIRTDLDVAIAFVTTEPPVDSLIPVWSLYRQSVQAWDRGVTGLRTAILASADDPEDATVVNEVADALAEIRAGDSLYLDLRVEFERDEIPEPISPLVNVRLSPADGGMTSLAVGYVSAARSSTNNLGLRPGLSLSQIATDPIWQISISGQAVVPATDSIVFSVVVTNRGNVASGVETLELGLTGGPEPIRTNSEIPALSPSGQTTVVFPAVAVEVDTLYEVSVALVVVDPDADLTDNSLSVQFTVNPS